MPDSASPKPRRWFQLHLSTCIVLMLAASVLIYVNLLPHGRERFGIDLTNPSDLEHFDPSMTFVVPRTTGMTVLKYLGSGRSKAENRTFFGWPLPFFCSKYVLALDDEQVLHSSPPRYEWGGLDGLSWSGLALPLALDLAAALAILAATALLCEFLLRRREARRS